jgi:hypothetical protein
VPVGIGDTAMLAIVGTVDGQDHIHTLHFRSTAVQLLSTLGASWQGTPLTAYRALFRSDDQCAGVIRSIHVCGSIPLNNSDDLIPGGVNQFGTRVTSTARMPSFVAALVAEKGVSSGRQNQGRFFIGGIQETDVLGNSMETSYMSLLQTYVNALDAAYVSAVSPAWRLVVHSRKRALPGVDCVDSSTLVAQLLPRTAVTTMRSRKVGHGG